MEAVWNTDAAGAEQIVDEQSLVMVYTALADAWVNFTNIQGIPRLVPLIVSTAISARIIHDWGYSLTSFHFSASETSLWPVSGTQSPGRLNAPRQQPPPSPSVYCRRFGWAGCSAVLWGREQRLDGEIMVRGRKRTHVRQLSLLSEDFMDMVPYEEPANQNDPNADLLAAVQNFRGRDLPHAVVWSGLYMNSAIYFTAKNSVSQATRKRQHSSIRMPR
ncbi:hypothetical protein B0H10DRAFT_1968268 [Mycena sp. CBHHK59/15]|nr:hypothetical protein B0H10DRAFT_1968268 [Mycena sp. CBHHK59/15]